MKKIIYSLVLFILLSNPCFAFTKNAVIFSDMKTAEKFLDESIMFNNFDYINKNPEKHIYNIGSEGIYSATVNLIRSKAISEGQSKKWLDAHYSCYFKAIDKNTILVKCTDNSSMGDTIGALTGLVFKNVGYRSYFKHLKYNGVEVVSYKKYKKLKEQAL
jgi:hypothetical protein